MPRSHLILLGCFAGTHQIPQCLGPFIRNPDLADRLGAVRNRSQAPYLSIRLCHRYGDRLSMDIQTQKS
jgi:hypothetical protein